MSTASITNSNPPRKQLSDQIDRLDGILDGLSEALNGAVADAAREGTRQAVKDAVIEIMTDPTLRARLHQATAPEPASEPALTAPKPGFWARLKACTVQAAKSVGQMACNTVRSVGRGAKALAANVAEAVRAVGQFGSLKRLAVVGIGGGIAFAAAAVLAPHAVTAALSAVSGAVAAAAVTVGFWTRRAVRSLAGV
jgi:hypothetical protein